MAERMKSSTQRVQMNERSEICGLDKRRKRERRREKRRRAAEEEERAQAGQRFRVGKVERAQWAVGTVGSCPSNLAVRRNYRVLCIKIDLFRLKRALDGL
jgi:hypothetical protein